MLTFVTIALAGVVNGDLTQRLPEIPEGLPHSGSILLMQDVYCRSRVFLIDFGLAEGVALS